MSSHQAARQPSRQAPSRRVVRPGLGILENRVVPASASLSAAATASPVGGYTPAQIRTAYAINALALDGTGQTIAILGLYNNPDLLADLDTFDKQFGTTASGPTLFQQYGPASSFMTVFNQNGQTSPLPGPDPTNNAEGEEVLDVEWAHAIAPGAKIDFVEANTATDADANAATVTAAGLPGVSVFSTSYGDSREIASETADDAKYTTPGVTFVVASGDAGSAAIGPPVFSPYFVAVGGTTLTLNAAGTYQGETGWGNGRRSGRNGGSGGGVSLYEPEPAYQQSVQSTGKRTAPDVAFDANPATGVAVADSYDDTAATPWTVFGGTSLGAPSWAGLMALVNQGRAAAGATSLDHSSPTQTLDALYSLSSSDFHDNLGGNNGTSTNGLLDPARYNEVTGLGSPVANLLVPALIAYGGTNQAPPAITSANNTTFTVGTPGTFAVTATGLPAPTLSESGALPSGVTFNAATGVLSGTAAAGTGGVYLFTFTASNGVGTAASQSFTLTVNQAPAIISAAAATFTVGTPGTFAVMASGFPIPTSSETGALPSGVTFSAGVLSGTPAAGTGGVYHLTFTASNGVGTAATQSFTFTVNQAPAITSAPSTLFSPGIANTFTVAASGFPTPALSASGALPAGVTFVDNGNGTATLGGTPAGGAVGAYALTITAANGTLPSATQAFTVTVETGRPTVQIPPVSPSPRSSAVSSMSIVFSQPVNGFTLSNLSLTSAGGPNLLTAAQTLTTTDNVTWMLGNLAALTEPAHRVAGFTLTLNPAGITGAAGAALAGGASTSFTEVDPGVTLQGQTLTVPGTSGNDTFTFTAGAVEQATLNGVTYALDPTIATTVQFQGNGGTDSATLLAAGTGNTATLAPGAGSLQGNGATVSVSGVTTLVVLPGGPSDTATLSATSGSNTFVGTPAYSYLKSGNQLTEVVGFSTVVASTTARSDSAYLYDTSGSNLFVSTPAYSYLRAGGALNEAIGFKTIVASAAASTSDAAYLYSASGSNTFVGAPTYASYVTGGVLNAVLGFQAVVTSAAGGTNDGATLYGAASNGTFIGAPTYAYYLTGGVFNDAVGFKSVAAHAQGGHDTAILYDGPGSNTFVATPTYAYLLGGGYVNEVVGFASVVAQATAGNPDSAFLYDAAGSNTFVGTPTYSYLAASSYFCEASGFGAVSAFSAAGATDLAYLYDSPGGDTFSGLGTAADLSGSTYGIALQGFAQVVAVGAAGATNHLHLGAIDYVFTALGTWTPS